jgi:hypothetical protein
MKHVIATSALGHSRRLTTVSSLARVLAEGMVTSRSGTQRCSTLNSPGKAGRTPAMSENAATAMTFGWAQSFMSGLNMINSSNGLYLDLSSISIEEQWAFIAAFCRQNPSNRIADAVIDLASKRSVQHDN